MPVSVVHIRKFPKARYIGRQWAEFPESRFHNPFRIGRDGTREEVIAKFAAYWYAPEQWDLRRAAWEIGEDEILGCWCKPEACHGDIIAGYLNWTAQRKWGSLW